MMLRDLNTSLGIKSVGDKYQVFYFGSSIGRIDVLGEYEELTDAKARFEKVDTMIWEAIKEARNRNTN